MLQNFFRVEKLRLADFHNFFRLINFFPRNVDYDNEDNVATLNCIKEV